MPAARRSPRRADALSSDRIIEAAIEILDAEGETALTTRALGARLSTGPGAIYHHVGSRDRLLAAATDEVIGAAMAEIAADAGAERAIRAISLGIFDAIDAHPWVGARLSEEPLQPAVLRIWKAVGGQLRRLGIAGRAGSDAGSALVNYVLGAAAQYGAGARRVPDDEDRRAYLEAFAARWTGHDADPLVSDIAAELREHDDRDQFLAGVEIFLAGIAASSA